MRFQVILALSLPAISTCATLKTLLSSHTNLSTIHGLLKQFNLLDKFNDLENITVIAPTNQAYLDLAKWGFNLSEVPAPVARALLSYHVLQGEHSSKAISAEGKEVMHTILKPPFLTNVTSGAAVKLGKDSKGKIVTESGLGVIGGVENEDLEFDGGVLHTLNASMVLPHNITLTAEINGLTKFLELMTRADMVMELEELQDVTVFVPSNDALRRVMGLLTLMNSKQLASLLKSHVIPNQVLYDNVLGDGGRFNALDGKKVRVERTQSGALRVNGVKVVKEDVILYAGVAHVIQDVLVPGADQVEGGETVMLPITQQGFQVPIV